MALRHSLLMEFVMTGPGTTGLCGKLWRARARKLLFSSWERGRPVRTERATRTPVRQSSDLVPTFCGRDVRAPGADARGSDLVLVCPRNILKFDSGLMA